MINALLILGLLGAMIAITYRFCSKWLLYHEKLRYFAQEYEKALSGKDKKHARDLGLTYYSVLRRGRVTQEDVESIEVDLELME
ncbi:hypothetical protein ACFQ4C_01685 [Larkinella insperata]|uniref:Uncharacterized protein n=1 Tax=Larkinella insperata TaxID=332158 RepID=A0ABW3Q428_9BACT|nr:hypothetical protein [Larkinella insperata]